MMRIRRKRNSISQLRIVSGARCPSAVRWSGFRIRLTLAIPPMFVACVIITSDMESRGQVVQLPTYRQFTVSTSVSVPDGGTASLAGNGYMAESFVGSGMPLFGPLGASRDRTRTSYSQHATVSASITEFRERDARLLAAAASREIAESNGGITSGGGSGRSTGELPLVLRPAGSSTSGGKSGPSGLAAADPGHYSVAELKQQRKEAQVLQQKESLAFYQRALSAESQGKPAVARSYYQSAYSRADSRLKEQITARLRDLP